MTYWHSPSLAPDIQMIKVAHLFRPPSLSNLVWLGFALTTGPLLLAIFFTMSSVDELTRLGRDTVYSVFQTTQQSRILLGKLTSLERSIKQYLVLDDLEFLDTYRIQHREFIEKLHEKTEPAEDKRIRQLKRKLELSEAELYRKMVATDLTTIEKRQALEGFESLNRLTHELLHISTNHVGTEVNRLEGESQRIIARMLTLTGLLLTGSIILVLVSVYLIVRPFRRLDSAIRSLGSGNFDQTIEVLGPRDLEYLGKRLDWLRQRLKNLEEAKQSFFRDVSHELKTPLAAIHEGVELLADEVVGKLNIEQKDITGILLKSSSKLGTLIEDILSFNQVQTSEKRSKREKINLTELILLATEEHQINLKANSLILDMHLDEVEMYGNADNIRTVLDNLLSNAIKYSPPNSRVRIALNKLKDYVRLEVEDEGPGIPAKERQKVFERFYQSKASLELGMKGSGLGLSIANECVTAHHGHIEVTEPGFGKHGALFRVLLPLDFRR